MTITDLVTAAFRELGVAPLTGDLAPALAALGRDVLNRLLDRWNAQGDAVYADALSTFTLTPSLNPHTIGPTGATWTLTQRPVSIEAISLETSTDVFDPVDVHTDPLWYTSISTPEQTGRPTDAWYNPAWGNGQIYFWPVPDTAYSLRLLTRLLLSSVTLTTTFTMPPGYQAALTDTLKEELARMPMFSSSASPELADAAVRSRANVFGQRANGVPLRTADHGMPGGMPGYFDYRTRELR